MTSLYLLLLITQSFALKYTSPRKFGGKTEFSDRGWKALIGHLSPEVKYGSAPTRECSFGEEPTCLNQFSKCSTTYFGKLLALKQPDTATLWVKWHQDATPFACDTPGGCTMTSIWSVADLTSQTDGWKLTASLNGHIETNGDMPTVKGKARAYLKIQHSAEPISSKSLSSKRSLATKCSQHHMCYIQTGTLMMTISGKCDSRPLIICDRRYFTCEEFNYPGSSMCSQWDDFTWKYCKRGVTKPNKEHCLVNVAVTDEFGDPISFQVFEQKPMPVRRSIEKRISPIESQFGELPDGSSGIWQAWGP